MESDEKITVADLVVIWTDTPFDVVDSPDEKKRHGKSVEFRCIP